MEVLDAIETWTVKIYMVTISKLPPICNNPLEAIDKSKKFTIGNYFECYRYLQYNTHDWYVFVHNLGECSIQFLDNKTVIAHS